ncbi:TRIM3 [Branchiostoma lanceolatum]|uniref:TRIM3 protein n=1 Tax=Branchiostoma lanceolatum TaxID=7740 RepID=A0A8J9Z108_BRALA|nr:TRIM3 [Branchiostoma lanceolatum]
MPRGVQGQAFRPNNGNRETFFSQPRSDEQGTTEMGPDAESQRQVLHDVLERVEPRAREVNFALNDVKMEMSEMPTISKTAIEQSNAYFDHLIALLRNRKDAAAQEIVSVHESVGWSLQTQKEAMESELAELTRASEFCKQALEHGGEVGEQELERVEELLTTPTDLTSKPSQVMLRKRKSVEDFRDDVDEAVCAYVQLREKVDASKCAVQIELEPAVVGFLKVSQLTTVDRYGRPCVVPVGNITAILKDPSGERIPTHLKEKARGGCKWDISYTPAKVTGKHRLEVAVNGRPVSGSPFDVCVESSHRPVFTVGSVTEVKDLPHPTDVAVDMRGNIAVVEEANKRVQIFDVKTSRPLHSFAVDVGFGGSPCCIDMDSNGRFFVTSNGQNQAVRVYSQEGELLETLTTGYVRSPFGVTVLRDGRMVVADTKRQACLLLQPDGSLIREIGKGYLRYPWFTAVDESRGLVFVSDHSAHKVLVFDLEGKFKVGFGKKGEKDGEFQNPSGIALDPAGNVLVVSRLDGRLQVFRPDGRYLRTAVKIRGGHPMGIVLTSDGYIAVACSWGNQTEFYKYN